MKTTYIYIALLLLAAGICHPISVLSQTPATDPNWKLCWQDEFNDTILNTNKWTHQDDFRASRICRILNGASYTNDLQAHRTAYTETVNGQSNFIYGFDSNANSGIIKLVVRKDTITINNGINYCTPPTYGNTHTYDYTAPAHLRSKTIFRYGYFEIRFRLPNLNCEYNNKGIGANFWLFSDRNNNSVWGQANNGITTNCSQITPPALSLDNCYNEIDIFEFTSSYKKYNPILDQLEYPDQSHYLTRNLHYKECGDTTPKNDTYTDHRIAGIDGITDYESSTEPLLFNDSFVVCGAAWFPDRVEYYVNNKLVYIMRNFHASELKPMHIIIDLNVFTSGEQPDANTLFPYSYDIDYVRVYNL